MCFYLLNRARQNDFVEKFKKNFPSPKMAAILTFEFLPKMAKQKFASISSTVREIFEPYKLSK